MAMTALERKHKQLERQRAKLKAAPEVTTEYLRQPFSEWLKESDFYNPTGDFMTALEWAGINPDHIPVILNDIDPIFDPKSPEYPPMEDEQDRGAIGRAERMSGSLRDAATALARAINTYKRSEINARIKELQEADLSDPEDRKKALGDIVRLTQILDRLNKEVRHAFPVTEVKA
jgi:hypothetical protein